MLKADASARELVANLSAMKSGEIAEHGPRTYAVGEAAELRQGEFIVKHPEQPWRLRHDDVSALLGKEDLCTWRAGSSGVETNSLNGWSAWPSSYVFSDNV